MRGSYHVASESYIGGVRKSRSLDQITSHMCDLRGRGIFL